MKNLLIVLLTVFILTSCADNKTINGVEYRPYGLINEDLCKNDSIKYQIAPDAVFTGIFFAECLLIPTFYTFGYNLWEPVCKKSDFNPSNKGVVSINNNDYRIVNIVDTNKLH